MTHGITAILASQAGMSAAVVGSALSASTTVAGAVDELQGGPGGATAVIGIAHQDTAAAVAGAVAINL